MTARTPPYPGDRDAGLALQTGFKSFIAPIHPAMVTNPNDRLAAAGIKSINAYDLAPDDFVDYGSVS